MGVLIKSLSLCCLFFLCVSSSVTAFLKVHFIDVYHGDAILIQKGDTNILIDGGHGYNLFSSSTELFSFLENKEIEKFDAIIGSHPHWDHIGGLINILNEYPVEKVYDSGWGREWGIYQTYIDLIEEKEIPFATPRRGETINVRNLKFEVLHPPEGVENYSINNASLVLRLDYGDVSFLFTGDIEAEAEQELVKEGLRLEADILKVPHHGLDTSSTEQFITKVDPVVAIIQDKILTRLFLNVNNVEERLKEMGIEVLRNVFFGHISVYTDGEIFWIEVQTGME